METAKKLYSGNYPKVGKFLVATYAITISTGIALGIAKGLYNAGKELKKSKNVKKSISVFGEEIIDGFTTGVLGPAILVVSPSSLFSQEVIVTVK